MTVTIDATGCPRGFPRAVVLSEGVTGNAVRTVYRALDAGGVADLDAQGAISALSDRRREQVVNSLRATAPHAAGAGPFLRAAADAIERGPEPEPESEPEPVAAPKKAPARKTVTRKKKEEQAPA